MYIGLKPYGKAKKNPYYRTLLALFYITHLMKLREVSCHLKAFGKVSCYCTGSGCTLNNKKVNGWDLGGDNKVNKNCQFRTSEEGTCFCRPGNQ